MLGRVDSTLENINAITVNTRTLSENTFPRIPGLLSQAEDVLLSTDRLINSINNIWLFRDGSNPAGKQIINRGDSYE